MNIKSLNILLLLIGVLLLSACSSTKNSSPIPDENVNDPIPLESFNDLETKLTASDGAANDQFGRSVAISGATAVVGAGGDDDNGPGSGSAYIFTHSGTNWTEQAKLTASDGVTGDWFGSSVAISGDTAIVGARHDNPNSSKSGSAYVFVRSGTSWTQQAKLIANDGGANDEFGISVAISGDTVIVGAWGDDDVSNNIGNAGAAYIFTRSSTNWIQQAKIVASDRASDDDFGLSVSISGDTAIVGSYGDDDNGARSGSAYIFARAGSSWLELDSAS